jgi:hypothetical protein
MTVWWTQKQQCDLFRARIATLATGDIESGNRVRPFAAEQSWTEAYRTAGQICVNPAHAKL